jgi:hypothetical protein
MEFLGRNDHSHPCYEEDFFAVDIDDILVSFKIPLPWRTCGFKQVYRILFSALSPLSVFTIYFISRRSLISLF